MHSTMLPKTVLMDGISLNLIYRKISWGHSTNNQSGYLSNSPQWHYACLKQTLKPGGDWNHQKSEYQSSSYAWTSCKKNPCNDGASWHDHQTHCNLMFFNIEGFWLKTWRNTSNNSMLFCHFPENGKIKTHLTHNYFSAVLPHFGNLFNFFFNAQT